MRVSSNQHDVSETQHSIIGVESVLHQVTASKAQGIRSNIARYALATLLLVPACAEVPPEAVTLSVTVGKDLENVHRSHRALAEHYFGRMKKDINTFVDTKYRPFLIERTLTEPRTIAGRTVTVWEILAREVEKPGGGKIIQRMESTIKKITNQVEKTRQKYLKPIESQERQVLRAIDDTYANIQNAHAIVTGHLASIRKVQQIQEKLLDKVGLKDVRRSFIDTTADFSDKISTITTSATATDTAIKGAIRALDDVIKAAKKTFDDVKKAGGGT